MTSEVILGALVLFVLRIANITISTISVILIIRRRRAIASVTIFIEVLIWAVVVANVIKDLGNWINLLAYAGGFSAGNYAGMLLEARFVSGYVNVTIVLSDGGHELARLLRERGFGVTETWGEGQEGRVTMLTSVIVRQNLSGCLKVVQENNPDAFVTVDDVRSVQKGWIQSLREMTGSHH